MAPCQFHKIDSSLAIIITLKFNDKSLNSRRIILNLHIQIHFPGNEFKRMAKTIILMVALFL